jgi:hypothetical protein
MATSSPTHIPHQIRHGHSPRLRTLHLLTALTARRHHPASHTPRGGVNPPNALWRGLALVVNGLALTCKFYVRHCREGPETATGAYGTCCKPAYTVHAESNFNLNDGEQQSARRVTPSLLRGWLGPVAGLSSGSSSCCRCNGGLAFVGCRLLGLGVLSGGFYGVVSRTLIKPLP